MCDESFQPMQGSHKHENQVSDLYGVWPRGAGMAQPKALTSYQCGPGSTPSSGVKCGLSLLVLCSAPRGFLRVLPFPLSTKTKISLVVLMVNFSYSVRN